MEYRLVYRPTTPVDINEAGIYVKGMILQVSSIESTGFEVKRTECGDVKSIVFHHGRIIDIKNVDEWELFERLEDGTQKFIDIILIKALSLN